MQSSSNFLKLSAIFCVIVALTLIGFVSQHAVSAAQAQATAAPTAQEGTAAPSTPTQAATEGAYPPCPAAVTPVPVSISNATQAVAPVATEAATTAVTDAAASPTQGATAAATGAEPSASTPEATSEATVVATAVTTASPMVVGDFQTTSGCILTALLAGPNELPKPGNANATGVVILTITRPQTGPGQICAQITTSNLLLPATMAHIHAGPANIAGPVVVPLAAPDSSGKSSSCTSGVDPSLIKAILLYPQDYYVNVHTGDFPGGAARGQLMPTGTP